MGPFGIFIFTKIASTTTLVICLLFIFLFLIKIQAKQKAFALLVSAVGLFSAVILAKNYFQTARPVDSLVITSGYAFPSGHAAGVTFLAILVTFLSWHLNPLYRYAIMTVCIVTVAVVSYSRIFLHVHTWFQVLAGLSFGAFFGFLFIYLSKLR